MYSPEEVVVKYDKMINKAAHKYHFKRNGITDFEDLVEEGRAVAIKAAANFDESKGKAFPVYLTCALNNELRKFAGRNYHSLSISEGDFRKMRGIDSLPPEIRDDVHKPTYDFFHQNGRIEFTDSVFTAIPSGNVSPEEFAMEKEIVELLREEISELPERERDVINMRFYGEMTLAEIASQMNSSKQTISTLEKRGVAQLRNRMAKKLGD